MSNQDQLKYWLDSLKLIKYKLKELEDTLKETQQQLDALVVGIRLSPLYDERDDK